GVNGQDGAPGAPGAPGQNAFITLATPVNVTLVGAKLSDNTTHLGGSSADDVMSLNRLSEPVYYNYNTLSSSGLMQISLQDAVGSSMFVSIQSSASNISALAASNITSFFVSASLKFPVTGGYHQKDFSTFDPNLNNPDTININAISYNSSTGILTLNLTLQDDTGDGDSNTDAIKQALNGNTGPASGTITMQIPVANVTSRTL
ncbi:MAG: hypothetical protein ACK40K_07335, partial [Raineya sp.]